MQSIYAKYTLTHVHRAMHFSAKRSAKRGIAIVVDPWRSWIRTT